MCSVYKNALFTIAASRATTGDEGLFSPQDSRLHTPCYIPRYAFLTGKGIRYNIHLAPAKDDNSPSLTQYTPKGPLYDRAWVLQEELLSHATLAFTTSGMTWQCSSSTSISADPEGVNDVQRVSYLRDAIMLSKRYSRNPAIVQKEKEKWEAWNPEWKGSDERNIVRPGRIQLYRAWAEMVEQYLMRGITHSSDRLPALSGLAQGMQEVLSDSYSLEEYLAGLWKFDLERGLLWTPHFSYFSSVELHMQFKKLGVKARAKRRIRPPMKYAAPSWSWASLWEIRVSWGGGGHYEFGWEEGWVEVLAIERRMRGGNRFGNLEYAALSLHGMLCSVEVLEDDVLYDVKLDKRVGKLLLDEEGPLLASEKGLVLMPVLSSNNGRGGDGYGINWLVSCLALMRTGLKENEFRRVGLGLVFETGFFDGIPRRELSLV
jgi:hypothetical protein